VASAIIKRFPPRVPRGWRRAEERKSTTTFSLTTSGIFFTLELLVFSGKL